MKHYMIGNFVRSDDNVYRVARIGSDGIYAERVSTGIVSILNYDAVESIPLTDWFFRDNGFKFLNTHVDDEGVEHAMICRNDGRGPAVAKESDDHGTTYSVAGIIVRTVDDWQNLMNICRCDEMAQEVTVKENFK